MKLAVASALSGICLLAASPSWAYHNCGVAPRMPGVATTLQRKIVELKGGEYVTVWRGQNWKGRVFVKILSDAGAGSGEFWTNVFGGVATKPENVSDFRVFHVEAEGDGAELKFKAAGPSVLMACSLQEFHEDDEEVASMFVDLSKCGTDTQCLEDRWGQRTKPHFSDIFPDK